MQRWARLVLVTGLSFTYSQYLDMTREQINALAAEANRLSKQR